MTAPSAIIATGTPAAGLGFPRAGVLPPRIFRPGRPVGRAAVQKVLQAAGRPAVVVHRGDELFGRLAEALHDQPAAARAAVHVYWTVDASRGDEDVEVGVATGSALLAALDQGLDTALLSGPRARVDELLGLPEGVTVARIQLIGQAGIPEAAGRRPEIRAMAAVFGLPE